MPKTNKRKKYNKGGEGGGSGEMGVIKKWIKIFPANLLRSTHYLNLQPQQPLPPPPPNAPHLILLSCFLTIVLPLSSTRPLSVSLSPFLPHLNFPGLMFLQECSLPPLHTTGLKEGVWSWWEGLRFWPVLGGKEDFRSLSLFPPFLPLPRLASLCDLWSLTSCLHMGGHGCGVEGVLKWEEWGRV